MLTDAQNAFLSKLSPEKAERIVHVRPFDPKLKNVAQQIMERIRQELPQVDVFFIGAAALEIIGENDVDLAVISAGDFDNEERALTGIFGRPTGGHKKRYTQWEFEREGFPVELSLNNDMALQIKEQIDFFKLLTSDPELKHEYEQMKLAMKGKPYRQYQSAKYEFYNRVLGLR